MSETKRFYWLKLQEDFFEDETIRYIEEQENGIKYSNFYLKLCLKSLRTNGRLIRLVGEMLIPYDVKSLAALTGVDVDTVRCAMALFEKIGCVKVLDGGELFISQLSELVGSETDKAKMMRRLRASEKVTMLPECYQEKEKEIDKDKEKEDGRNLPARKSYGEYGWVKLSDAEYNKLLNDYGSDKLNHTIKYIDELAQSTGNKNKWKDWNLVVRRAIRDGWGVKPGEVEEEPKKQRRFETVLIDGEYVSVEV